MAFGLTFTAPILMLGIVLIERLNDVGCRIG